MNMKNTSALLLLAAATVTVGAWGFQDEPQHSDPDWWETHGQVVLPNASNCATCHAQPSCTSCHVDPVPAPIEQLPAEGGIAPATRNAPPTHTPFFADDHRALGAAAASQCSTCHTRNQCLSCHTTSEALTAPGRDVAGYHPANFFQQHSAAAFSREVECSTCHNQEAFCRDCHAAQGFTGTGRINAPFHNAKPNWVFGHGSAARQGLESCATCHSQRDCLACHSALAGRRISPHGPGFNGEELADKAPSMCLRCHRIGILDDD